MKLFTKHLKVSLVCLMLFCVFMLNACGGGGGGGSNNPQPAPGLSGAKEITSYKVNGIDANIDQQTKAISVILPFGTDLANTAVILTTSGASVTVGRITHQTATITATHDFTQPIDYLVTARDGSVAKYTAKAIVAPNTAKAIIAFSLNGVEANVIDEAAKTISVILPYGTDLSNLLAKYTTTGAKVTVNGIAQIDTGQAVNYFSNPTREAFYMVTSAQGETQAYLVKVTIAPNSATAITTFLVDGVQGNIDEAAKTISVILPAGTDRTKLLVKVTTAGESLFVDNAAQAMEAFVTHFATDAPVLYKIVARDGTTTNTYTVNVMTAQITDTRITKFSAGGILGHIDEAAKTILVVLPAGTDRTNLLVKVTTMGKALFVNNKEQAMEDFVTHFSTPVAVPYMVVAADGKSTQTYMVTVIVASSTTAMISKFSLNGSNGIIDQLNKTISIILPHDINTSSLLASFTTEGGGRVFDKDGNQVISGELVNHFKSTLSVLYKVIAADGTSSQTYTVNVSIAPNTATVIKDFSLNGYPGIIDQVNKTILVPVPTGTDVTSLQALFSTEGKGTLSDKDGKQIISGDLVTNFTPRVLSVPYTVTAEDKTTTATYIIKIKMDNNADSRITAFSLSGISGTINQANKTISVILPRNINRESLKLEYVTRGMFSINGSYISSGMYVGHFHGKDTAICDVTSMDKKSTTRYTVNVIIGPSNAAVISEFSLNGASGTIDQMLKTISVTLPYNTNPSSLQVLFKTEGEAGVFDKNGKTLATGDLVTDFHPTLSATYKVVAEDKTTTQIYTVNATISPAFLPYYPKGCTLNDDAKGIVGTCKCIQDSTTHDIWLATPSSGNKSWGGNAGANDWAASFDLFGGTCGFDTGWNLPQKSQLDTMARYVTNEADSTRATWFNNHGFVGMDNTGNYWGVEQATDEGISRDTAWYLGMSDKDLVLESKKNVIEPNNYAWAVHSDGPAAARHVLKCWGSNNHGQINVPPLNNPRMVSAGDRHTCALDDDGLHCWGFNGVGQVEIPNTVKNTRMVSAGGNHTCALDYNGNVQCWGYTGGDVPNTLSNPRTLATGVNSSCTLDDGGVKCWGSSAPSVPASNPRMVSIGAGGFHMCTLDDNGVHCWGANGYGQSDVPTTLKNPREVVAGGNHTCALDDNGVHCWGANGYGQSNVPTTLKNPRKLFLGGRHSCALDDNGLQCWGDNGWHQIDVPELKNMSMLSAGDLHMCSISEE